MIDYSDASEILSQMVQITRTFRIAGQRNTDQSLIGTKFGVLQQLLQRDARMSELADRVCVSAPVASRAIDSLETEGMVERRADPQDARAALISITHLGRTKLTEKESSAVNRFATALADWSPADAESAVSMLKRLNAHLIEITQPSDSAPAAPTQRLDDN